MFDIQTKNCLIFEQLVHDTSVTAYGQDLKTTIENIFNHIGLGILLANLNSNNGLIIFYLVPEGLLMGRNLAQNARNVPKERLVPFN
jgi:hypothetical protein